MTQVSRSVAGGFRISGLFSILKETLFFGVPTRKTVHFQTGETSSSATTMPFDDTIPQNTEGYEVMSLGIVPEDINDVLDIDVSVQISASNNASSTVALFKDGDVNAIAARGKYISNTNLPESVSFRHRMVAGTLNPITFKVRIGNVSYTSYFNGIGTGRIYGGACVSSITITESRG